jgi:hypothetical protein
MRVAVYIIAPLSLLVKPSLAQERKSELFEFSLEMGSSFPFNAGDKNPESPLSHEKEGVGGCFRIVIPVSNEWLLSLRWGGMNYAVSDKLDHVFFDSLQDNYYTESSILLATFHGRVNAAIGYRLDLGRASLTPEVSVGINSVDLEGSSYTIKRKGANEEYRVSVEKSDKAFTDLGFSLGTRFTYPLIKGINFSITPQFFIARERMDVTSQFEGLGGKTRTYTQHYSGTMTAFSIYAGIGFCPGAGCCCLSIPGISGESDD